MQGENKDLQADRGREQDANVLGVLTNHWSHVSGFVWQSMSSIVCTCGFLMTKFLRQIRFTCQIRFLRQTVIWRLSNQVFVSRHDGSALVAMVTTYATGIFPHWWRGFPKWKQLCNSASVVFSIFHHNSTILLSSSEAHPSTWGFQESWYERLKRHFEIRFEQPEDLDDGRNLIGITFQTTFECSSHFMCLFTVNFPKINLAGSLNEAYKPYD